MSFINQISVKTRILVLVIIPLIATVILAIERYRSANNELENVKRLEILQQYIGVLSPLISSLQEERFYSRLYMGPTNPSNPVGTEFKPDVANSRVAVDKALNNYKKFVADRERLTVFPALLEGIDNADEYMQKFGRVRQNVDQRLKKTPIQDGDSGRFFWTSMTFNLIIASLNDSSNEVVLLASNNPELSLLANSYKYLTQAQDTMMLQVSNIYESTIRPLNTSTFGALMEGRRLEEKDMGYFLNYAPNDLKGYYREHLGSTESLKFAKAKYLEIRKKVNNLIGEPLPLEQKKWLTVLNDIKQGYQKVIDQTLNQIEQTKSRLYDEAQSAVWTTALALVILILLVIIVSSFIIRSINRPLKQLIDDLTELAETKNMTLRSNTEGNNELSQVAKALNSLIITFEKTLFAVRDKVSTMDGITQDVSVSVGQSMTSIEEQRESTNSISVAINQMTSTIHEVSSMSTTTSDAVVRAYNLSAESEEGALQSKATMDQLFFELGETNQLVEQLSNEANEINNILQVIRGISEQTNLLALNAAIEAARAGESGRGFAVVADEVRELSKRTHDSTDQIQSQIEALNTGAAKATQKMSQLQGSCQQAVDVVQNSTDSFITIKSELNQITDMATQIAVAAEEQTSVADEINKQIHGIKDGSDVMHKQGVSTKSATETLLQGGNELKEKIGVFHF